MANSPRSRAFGHNFRGHREGRVSGGGSRRQRERCSSRWRLLIVVDDDEEVAKINPNFGLGGLFARDGYL